MSKKPRINRFTASEEVAKRPSRRMGRPRVRNALPVLSSVLRDARYAGSSGRGSLRLTALHSVHLPMVTRPPAASTASVASATLATCSTVGFLASSMSPLATLLSTDHCVRLGLKPSLTDHTQFLVSTSQAYSTASLGFC